MEVAELQSMKIWEDVGYPLGKVKVWLCEREASLASKAPGSAGERAGEVQKQSLGSSGAGLGK